MEWGCVTKKKRKKVNIFNTKIFSARANNYICWNQFGFMYNITVSYKPHHVHT